jgi:hypothetical protein
MLRRTPSNRSSARRGKDWRIVDVPVSPARARFRVMQVPADFSFDGLTAPSYPTDAAQALGMLSAPEDGPRTAVAVHNARRLVELTGAVVGVVRPERARHR